MAKKKTVKKAGTRLQGQPPDEVQQLAQSLDTWAKKLPPRQQTLLRWLLSRAKSRQIKIGKGISVTKINIDETNIKEAVTDALASFRSLDLPGPGWSNWQHIYPWQRIALDRGDPSL